MPSFLISLERVIEGLHDDEIFCPSNSEAGSEGSFCGLDRPIILQLAGNDIESMIAAGERVQRYVDAIDINLSCPQKCAEMGQYGAFLLQNDLELACAIVKSMVESLVVPVTAKIRLISTDLQQNIAVAIRLQEAGVSALCIHGRFISERDHQVYNFFALFSISNI